MNEAVKISQDNMWLVSAFWSIREFMRDHEDPIKPADVFGYLEYSGDVLTPQDCGIILAMDAMFRKTLSAEIAFNTSRRMEQEKRAASRVKGGR